MKTNPVLKTVAFLVCAVSAAISLWAGLFTLIYWEDIWTEPNYFYSDNYRTNCYDMQKRVEEVLRLELAQEEGGLTYTQQERLSALRDALDPANTNYRYELRLNSTGELLMTNLGASLLENVADGVQLGTFSFATGEELHSRDDTYYLNDENENEYGYNDGYHQPAHILEVWTGTEYLRFSSVEDPYSYNEYGWRSNGNGWYSYRSEYDSRVTRTDYALRSGVLRDLPIDDVFLTGRTNYWEWHMNLPLIGIAALVSIALFLVTLLYLLRAAGYREGVEGISLRWPDRIPLDVYALAVFSLLMMGVSLGDSITDGLNMEIRAYRIVGLLAVSAVVAALVLGFLLTAAVRIKARQFWRSLLCWRVCVWCWSTLVKGIRAIFRGVKELLHALSMNARLGLAFLVYLVINAFLAAGFFLTYRNFFYFIGLILFNGGVFWLGCRWIAQWRSIRENTRRIVGGDSGIQIDTRKMYGDLKEHVEQLNDLGTAIDHAVDERLKSEHFKAELITNVSHDLKTPLTSIINYVDLLKKLDINDPKAREYLEVLDRKGQRLKKLTEDLVEASKASTGNITVDAVRMDLVEFTQQAAAEYEDRLSAQGLTLIPRMSENPIFISADGRHMWRILDNLLGNCAKYAMEGTRVYLEVTQWDGKASISIKNISRDPIAADPESLTERFVRGDESRTTEGSGLGLSIARSLTEVQGGTFRLSTDGDLFKVTVYFPVVLALEQNNLGEPV